MKPIMIFFAAVSSAVTTLFRSRFSRDWKTALHTPQKDAVPGPWEGGWENESAGRSGSLRCLITATSLGQYRARFRADWGPGLALEFTVPLAAARVGDVTRLGGQGDIGWLCGGLCKYTGRVAHGGLVMDYHAANGDHGRLHLRRPAQVAARQEHDAELTAGNLPHAVRVFLRRALRHHYHFG